MTHNEVVGLRAHLEKLMDERDRRYTERAESDQRAVNAALAAAEKAVNAALAAAEKAAEKFEQALKEYKGSSNEWRSTLNDVVVRMMPRADWERENNAAQAYIRGLLVQASEQHKHLDAQIADLRESRSGMMGRDVETEKLTTQQQITTRWLIGLAVSVALSVLYNLLR